MTILWIMDDSTRFRLNLDYGFQKVKMDFVPPFYTRYYKYPALLSRLNVNVVILAFVPPTLFPSSKY